MDNIRTYVTMVSCKQLDADDKESILEEHDADDISDVAESMEPVVEKCIRQLFREAEIELLDVTTEVE